MLASESREIQVLNRNFLREWFIPRLPRLCSRRRGKPLAIGIIGAGVSGLCAAYELSNLGFSTTVLEAASRIGGRIYTHRFSPEQYGELGAMRIPDVHSAVKHYVECFGLRIRPFRSNSITRATDFDSHRLYEELLIEIWKDIRPVDLLGLRANRLESIFAKYERLSLKEFLSSRTGPQDCDRLLAGEHMNAYKESSFLETVLGFLNYKDGSMCEIVGGLSCLSDAFAAAIQSHPGCSLRTKSQVHAIYVGKEGVTVRGRNTRPFEGKFDFVICAVPPAALAQIQFEPGLNSQTREALGSHYIAASKTIGLFSKSFWRSAINGGVRYVDSDSESLWYPSSDLRVLTLQYSRGDAALRFSEFDLSRKETVLVEHLRRLHPGANIQLLDIIHESWKSPITSGGGFCRLKPGQFSRQCVTAPWAPIPLERPTLFFAGEAYSLTHGWIQGAIESALNAVQAVADTSTRLQRTQKL
jgi:monoamine oxidase